MRTGLKIIFSFFLSIAVLLFFSKTVFAQLMINEINPFDEWVELFNTTSETIDLTGWTLEDATNPAKNLSGTIPANGLFIYQNSGNWLNNSGPDKVVLRNSGLQINEVGYGSGIWPAIPNTGKCVARTPNGSDTLSSDVNCTQNNNNPNAPTPTATSTSTPTATPTSTPTTTPTSAPAVTKTPTPKPTKIPSPTPDYTPGTSGAGDSGSEDSVLGIRNELATATPEAGKSGGGKSFPVVAGVVMGLGSLCVVGSGVWFFKIRKGTYNGASEEKPPTLS